MGLSILVPVYNEADNILSLLGTIEKSVKTPHKVYLIYDLDKDTTLPPALRWQSTHPNLILMRNRMEPGPAHALRAGFAEVGAGAVVVVMADLSDRIEDIDTMYRVMGRDYSIVVGSRYTKGGQQKGGPWLKSALSRMAGLSLHWLTGISTWDVTNSFKMYRREALSQIELRSHHGFEVSMEITVKAFIQGMPITEVPTIWKERVAGKSRFRLLHWMPQYLRWYFYTILRRNRLWWIK